MEFDNLLLQMLYFAQTLKCQIWGTFILWYFSKKYLFEGQEPLPGPNATDEEKARILGPGWAQGKPYRCGVPALLGVAADGGQGSCTVDQAGNVVDYTAGMVLQTGSGTPS